VQLAVLLYLTGGLTNPFALLLLAPVAIGGTILSLASNIALSLLTIVSIGLLGVLHLPLPWNGPPPSCPRSTRPVPGSGMTLTALLVTLYGWRLAEEQRQMSDALLAAQAALAQEQRMSSLGALAAAAAHELGSPLSTIAVATKEMLREVELDDPLREDIELLVAESDRCRSILARLTVDPAGDVSDAYVLVPLPALIEAAAQHYHATVSRSPSRRDRSGRACRPPRRSSCAARRSCRVSATLFRTPSRSPAGRSISPPAGRSNGPRSRSPTTGRASRRPCSTSSARRSSRPARRRRPHGLGVFIAKTLLERTGASVSFGNRSRGRAAPAVAVRWPNPVFKAT
jgi:two-component system sensor histidine kinase RegB